jgi:hypothetical protein
MMLNNVDVGRNHSLECHLHIQSLKIYLEASIKMLQ